MVNDNEKITKTLSLTEIGSACLGNFFEHYDAALFGVLSPFLAPLIFPEYEQVNALILTYMMIPIGMIARPIGALFFGYIGDVYNRNFALFLSLVGMGIISLCMAISPTFEQVGLLAPIIFCLGRIGQNFCASGEHMGGAIFLLENSQQQKHDIISSIYSASTIGGIVLASLGLSFFLSRDSFDWGWRVLYFLGGVTAFFGLIIRKYFPLSVSEKKSTPSILPLTSPFLKALKSLKLYHKELWLIAVMSGFSYATYSIALIYINGFIPLISIWTKEQMSTLNTGLLILDLIALPFFGWLASKISREKMMIGAAIGVAITAIPLSLFLENANFMVLIGIRSFIVLLGVAFFAPFHAWAQQLIPKENRYTVLSFGYALGSQLLGAPAAPLSLGLFKTTGMVSSICWYWVILAIISSLLLLRRQINSSLSQDTQVDSKILEIKN